MNDSVFQFFSEILLNFDETHPSLPTFSKSEIVNVCAESQNIFQKEQTQLNLTGNFIIVGDLHGHVFDLIKIFKNFGIPPNKNYIFLGDIVDRGNFSTSVATLILALKTKYPDCVYLLRGNHEFRSVCSNSGFFDEIQKIYKSEDESNAIFNAFINVFNSLPLVACINNNYICVHGGIGPKFQKIEQLKNIVRPMNEIYGGISDEILWSDPSENVDLYRSSQRGIGYEFGQKAISDFLRENKYKLLIRAHQQIQNGFEYSLDNLVLTVFSASNYCGEFDNFCGIVIIDENSEKEEPIQLKHFDSPIPFESVTFLNSEERTADLLKASKRKERSKSFRVSSSKSSSLPSFNLPKKKLRQNRPKSILHENFACRTAEVDNECANNNDNFNKNADEVEIDQEMTEVQLNFENNQDHKPKNNKKKIQSLRIDKCMQINVKNLDGADPPRSLSARTPNGAMSLPFSIRSRKGVPVNRKLDFS